MKDSGIKFLDKIIVSLLSLLGILSSNSCATEYGMPPVEYGSPSASYEIKGAVADEENGQPLKNIRVIRKIYQQYRDTLYTDREGKYYFEFDGEPPLPEVVTRLKVEDIDGYFEPKEIDVTFTEEDKGDRGVYVKTQNIELQQPLVMYGMPYAEFEAKGPNNSE